MSQKKQKLEGFWNENQTSFKCSSLELSNLISSTLLAYKEVIHEVSKASSVTIIGTAVYTNSQNKSELLSSLLFWLKLL